MIKKFLNRGISTPIALGIILILVAIVGGFALLGYSEISESREPLNIKTPENEIAEKDGFIRVFTPRIKELIKSPLEIKGVARGYWFFEGSFPIELLDGEGNIISRGMASALTEWMTEDFVSFNAILEFYPSKTGEGTIVLKKDNPSGLPENDDELRIPIIFQKVETITVKVFFNNNELDPNFSCYKVFPVEREIEKTKALARAALEELLLGPLESEEGFFTNINNNVKINSLTIEDGIARVDFDEQLEFQVGGSCRVSAIRAQITETLKQFSTVKDVIISINGQTEDILQP